MKTSEDIAHELGLTGKSKEALVKAIEIIFKEGYNFRKQDIIQNFNLSSIDAPCFTHTLEFREHFNYIKKELIKFMDR